MSNRIQEQINAAPTMRLSHLAQIDALTKEGPDDVERVKLFIDAAGFEGDWRLWALSGVIKRGWSPAFSVWRNGFAPLSLFAHLPGCACPVQQRLPGVPHYIPSWWRPTSSQLEPFSRIQLERRFPA